MKRAVLYLRVSTLDQTTANQERELREIAGRRGCEIVKVYKDHGISGAKGRDGRPQFDALCRDAAKRQFDVIMAWSVDRLGRSLQDLVGFLSEIHALKVDLYLHQQGLDTTTPAGKAMFQMLGVFAEFETVLRKERQLEGIAAAKKRRARPGVGRPLHLNPERVVDRRLTACPKCAAASRADFSVWHDPIILRLIPSIRSGINRLGGIRLRRGSRLNLLLGSAPPLEVPKQPVLLSGAQLVVSSSIGRNGNLAVRVPCSRGGGIP